MLTTILATTFSLFLLMDPIGNIPIYLLILKEINPRRRLFIILREKLIALGVILIFALFGNNFLTFLGISQESIYLVGGIVLFVMALKMIFPEDGSLAESLSIDGEPLIFPLAVPLVAGPSVLAAVMIYSKELVAKDTLFIAIILSWTISTIILLSSSILHKWLGMRGLKALERLMGLVLMLIAINMFLLGIYLCKGPPL